MRRTLKIVLAVLLSAGVCGCQKKPAPPPTVKPPADKQWTPEEMAKDPEGYLRWAAGKIEGQITQCEARQKSLQGRMAQVVARQTELDEKIKNAQNIHDRMEQAIRKSDDEDGRLPINVMGRSFSRDEAQQVVTASLRWIEERRPLEQDYVDAVGEFQSADRDLGNQIATMRRTRERLDLEIEKVRLNQGVAEMEGLKKTEAEIGSFAKALTKPDETVDLSSLAKHEEKGTGTVDIESLLKK